ncbi:hypothetical protein [Pelagibacterium halotolerans]|uniref:hypothetical protein n=1 Tax=Pelagibacterium halotolerans TaxID=531813 RepID=UPI00384DDF51
MSADAVRKPASLVKLTVMAVIGASLAVLVGANAHLVYVAFSSQPDCVSHSKTAGEAGSGFRAAKSSC